MQSDIYVSEKFLELIGLSFQIIECGLSIVNYSIVREMLDERFEIINTHLNTLEFIDLIFIKFKQISIEQFKEIFQLQNIDPEFIIKILDRCNQMKNSITNINSEVLQQRQETFEHQEILWRFMIKLKLNLMNGYDQYQSIKKDNVGRFPLPITQNYQFNQKQYDPFLSKISQLLQNNFLESQKLLDPFQESNLQCKIENLKIYYWLTFTYLLSFQFLNIHQQLVFIESSIQAYKQVDFNGWEPLYALLSSSNCWYLNNEMVNENIINPKLQFLLVLRLNQLINTFGTTKYKSNHHKIRLEMDRLNSLVGGQYIRNDKDYEKIFDKAVNLQKYYKRCKASQGFIDNLIFDTYQSNLKNYQLRLQIEDSVDSIRQEIQTMMNFIQQSALFQQICQEFFHILDHKTPQGVNFSKFQFKFIMIKDTSIQGITIINGIAYINIYELQNVFKDKVQLIRAIIGYTIFLLTHEFAHFLDQMILQSCEMNSSRKTRTYEEKQNMKLRAQKYDIFLDDFSLKFIEVGDLLEALLYGIKHKQQQRGVFYFNQTFSNVITNKSNWQLSKYQFQLKVHQSQTPHQQQFEMRKVKK